MKRIRFNQFWIVGLISSILIFILLYVGIMGILKKPVTLRSISVYIVLSLIYGILCGAFFTIRYRITFWIFTVGIFAGFFAMYNQFMLNADGWGDLTGLMSLLVWSGIGLASGLVLQLIWYLILQSRQKNRK